MTRCTLQFFLLFLFLQVSTAKAADFYWIGGTGNWSDTLHWSLASGGTYTTTIPTATDNVIFNTASGLTAASVVTLDEPATVYSVDFSLAATGFQFTSTEPFLGINGSLKGNPLMVFNWTGDFHFGASANQTITSNGAAWIQDFIFNVSSGFSIQLVDDLTTSGNFIINTGGFQTSSFTLTCANFTSTSSSPRTIDMTNGFVVLTGTTWNISPTALTFSQPQKITNSYTGIFTFNGAGFSYDTVTAYASDFLVNQDNSFKRLRLSLNSQLNLANGSIQIIDSLITSGTCSNLTEIVSRNAAGAKAFIQKAGYPIFTASNIITNNVGTSSPSGQQYRLQLSDTTNNSTGWTFAPSTFYWIGNGGDWTDPAHWSLSSNGPMAVCMPDIADSTVFDAASFSIPNQVVTINAPLTIGAMNWSLSDSQPRLHLKEDIYSSGDIILHPAMSVTRDSLYNKIAFTDQAHFDPDSCKMDCNITLEMAVVTDTLFLESTLATSDSSGLYLIQGAFKTKNNNVYTGTMQLINTFGKVVLLGSSHIELASGFSSDGVNSGLTFNAGTSDIYIKPNAATNYLLTEGLAFHDVTLEFHPSKFNSLGGSNIFHDLTVIKKSKLSIESSTMQSIAGNLIMMGTCQDSIYVKSSTAAFASFSKIGGTVHSECVALSNIHAAGTAAFTAYFSKNNGNNTNWIFSTAKPAVADFTIDSGFCFGDTTHFTNTTTSFSGDLNDVSFTWDFNGAIFNNDTNQYRFLLPGDHDIFLTATLNSNGCKDTITHNVHINKPDLFLGMSEPDTVICSGTPVIFTAQSSIVGASFEFFLNGTSLGAPSPANAVYTNSTLTHLDTVGAMSYENGCPSDSMLFFVFTVHDNPTVVLTSSDPDSTICATTPVTFTSTGAAVYQYHINGSPVTSFASGGSYSNSNLLDGDTLFVIGKNTTTQCVDTAGPIIMTVHPLPSPSLSESTGGNVICAGTPVTFTASGAATYEFFIDGTSQGAPASTSTFVSTTLTSGQVVTVKGYSALGCEKIAPQSFSYTVNSVPNAVLVSDDADLTICSGTPVEFTAAGGASYEFFINGTSQGAASGDATFTTSALADGDAVHAEVSFSGCTGSSPNLTFTVLSSPTTSLVSSDADATICQLQTVTFTASGATNYEFFVEGVSQGAPSTTATWSTGSLSNGETVRVEGESNGCFVSTSIQFTVLPIPNTDLFSSDPGNELCEGSSITLTAANAATYELFVNGVSQGTPQTSGTFTPVLPVGSNTVYVIGTAANGCSAQSQSTLTINVHAIPVIVLTSDDADNTICNGSNVTFTAAGSQEYQFLVDGVSQTGMTSTSTFSTTNLLSGQTVSVNGQSFGCPGTSNTLVFTVNSAPVVSLTGTDPDNVFCAGASVNYTASGATTYEFFVNGVSQGPPSAVNTINAASFAAGTYAISVNGTQSGCNGGDSKNIVVNPVPVVTITSTDPDNTICSNETPQFTGGGADLYQLVLNGIPQGTPQPIATFSPILTNGTSVSINGSTAAGCASASPSIVMTVNAVPVVSLTSNDTDNQVCTGSNITFTAGGATTYEFFVNGVSQGAASTTNTFSSSTLGNNASITVKGTAVGCSGTSNAISLTVYNYPIVSLDNPGGTEVCAGENTDFSGSGASNYLFLVNGIPSGTFGPGNTFTAPVVNGSIITLQGETNGCITTAPESFTMEVNAYPVINVAVSDPDNTLCVDDLVSFTATGAETYTFSLNGTTVSSGTSGLYATDDLGNGDVLSVIGYNGDCPSPQEDHTFLVHTMDLDLTATASTMICAGETVTFTASGASNYQFFVNGVATGPSSSTATYASSSLSDGDSVTFIGNSTATGCNQDFDYPLIMNVIGQPVITASSSLTFCDGDSVILYSNGSYGNQWYLDGNPIAGAIDTFYVAKTSGDYSLETTTGGNGETWSVGYNANGTFGNGDNFNSASPEQALSLTDVVQVSAGSDFTAVVKTDGTVYTWGKNNSGQVGNGTFTNATSPVHITALSSIKAVATSSESCMAVSTSGSVYVWGNNTDGQLGTGNTSVINFPFLNTAITSVDTIVGGKTHFVALKTDGTVWTVGSNNSGQLGQGNLTGSFNFQQVAGLSNIVSIGSGENHSFAIDNTGNLYAWGNNVNGQLGLGDITNRLTPVSHPMKHVVAAHGGATHSAFLTDTKHVYTSGANDHGQLGTGNFDASMLPVELSLTGIVALSAGEYTTLALGTDHSVHGFGNNSEQQLHASSSAAIATPVLLEDVDGVTIVEAGRRTSHFVYGISTTCGSAETTVTVLQVTTPVITENNGLFTSSTAASYQWYIDGVLIPGATNQTYQAIATGNYSVSVTYDNGCSALSDELYYHFVGIGEYDNFSFTVFPNPTSGRFTMRTAQPVAGLSIVIRDVTGRAIFTRDLPAEIEHTFDLSTEMGGVYFIQLINANETIYRVSVVKLN